MGPEEEVEAEVGTLSRRVDQTTPGLDPPSRSLWKACHRFTLSRSECFLLDLLFQLLDFCNTNVL